MKNQSNRQSCRPVYAFCKFMQLSYRCAAVALMPKLKFIFHLEFDRYTKCLRKCNDFYARLNLLIPWVFFFSLSLCCLMAQFDCLPMNTLTLEAYHRFVHSVQMSSQCVSNNSAKLNFLAHILLQIAMNKEKICNKCNQPIKYASAFSFLCINLA